MMEKGTDDYYPEKEKYDRPPESSEEEEVYAFVNAYCGGVDIDGW